MNSYWKLQPLRVNLLDNALKENIREGDIHLPPLHLYIRGLLFVSFKVLLQTIIKT